MVTPYGIVNGFREVQLSKANLPISVTVFGIETEASLVKDRKARVPIVVAPSSIVTLSMEFAYSL